MEGVGARLGRTSTRYGPATVFSGPVRKWKKQWVHVRPPASSNHSSSHANHHHHHHNQSSAAPANGSANGSNGSHLLLYKWTPINSSQNNGGNSNGDAKKDTDAATEEPSRRKFKYIPVAVLEEQNREIAEQLEDESKPSDSEMNEVEQASKHDSIDEKPDINDVPAEENQASENNPLSRQDLNESTLDLSLGLKAHDSDNDPDPKANHMQDGQPGRLNPMRS